MYVFDEYFDSWCEAWVVTISIAPLEAYFTSLAGGSVKIVAVMVQVLPPDFLCILPFGVDGLLASDAVN